MFDFWNCSIKKYIRWQKNTINQKKKSSCTHSHKLPQGTCDCHAELCVDPALKQDYHRKGLPFQLSYNSLDNLPFPPLGCRVAWFKPNGLNHPKNICVFAILFVPIPKFLLSFNNFFKIFSKK